MPQPGREKLAGARPKRTPPAGVVLTIPSDTALLSLVRDVTRRLAALAGFSEETSGRLALAVDECTTNVIRHAYRGQPGQPIELRFSPDGNEFRVEVLDDGEAVDPRAVPRVDLRRYAAERRKGGLGVHLMAKLMDSVSYSRCSSRNLCRMVKRKPRAGRARD